MSTISPHTTTELCTHWNLCFLWSILVQDIAVMHGLVYRTINPVPLKKTEYNCNYTSELHRHLSEENLNAKYPSPHPTTEINTKCYIVHYNTSMLANVHWNRYILYIQCFRNQIYSHLMWLVSLLSLQLFHSLFLKLFTKIKFQVLQVKI